MKLKPLSEQVVVVLGASSGIGRQSALQLAERGARLVVAARNEPALQSLVEHITIRGGQGVHVVCDVADPAQVQAVAETAVATFGRIDTWVNNVAVLVHAPFEETQPEQFRRLMEVNYLGQVHGALAALPHLREAGGGALIAVSSVESTVAVARHSAYSASKHAVEGVIDGLRRDLLADKVPISVTSVKPAAINPPIFTSAAHTMDVQPKGPPPVYQPSVVADCVVHAAEHPVRDLWAGWRGAHVGVGPGTGPTCDGRPPSEGRAPPTVLLPRPRWIRGQSVRAPAAGRPHAGRLQLSGPQLQHLRLAADPPTVKALLTASTLAGLTLTASRRRGH